MRARQLIRRVLLLGLLALAPTASAGAAPLNPSVELNAMSCPSVGNCSAVGIYTDGVSHGQGLLLDERHGRWSGGVRAPLPRNAGVDPLNPANNTGIAAVDCLSAGNCTAVGVYTDASNNDRGLLLTESHGRWRRGVEARLPANVMSPSHGGHAAGDNLVLLGVGCVSPGSCYAVGNYVTGSNTLEPMIIAERHGRWAKGRVAPMPPGAAVRGQKAVLYAITCLSSGVCSATGAYVDANGAQQAMLLTESGGSWSAATEGGLPANAGASPAVTPVAISCATAGECAVVGNYQDNRANALGDLLSEVGGTWQPGAEAQLPANAAPPTSYNAQTTVLISVSCPAAQSCAAVGSYTDNFGNTQALLLGQSAGVWAEGQEVQLPSNAELAPTDQTAGLDTVDCPAVGDCVAGGDYTDTAENTDSLIVTESGGVWAPGVEVRLPHGAGGAQYSAVDSIVCSSVGNCTALGTYNDGYGDTLAFELRERGGVWGRAVELTTPVPDALEIRMSVQEMLTPVGKDATVAAIRKAGQFRLPYVILKPGRLTVRWFAAGTKGHAEVLVAGASADSRTISQGRLAMRLTAAGRKLFAHGGRVNLTAVVALVPRHGHPVSATKSFTIS